MYKQFKAIAEENDIPYAVETMPRNSGTDAMYMQIVNSGIPCAVIGIPLRYMHTPVEEVVLSDIQRTGRLLAAFIKNLEPDTLDQLSREMQP
jgi:endoglucanase